MMKFDKQGALLEEMNQEDRKRFWDMLSIIYNISPEYIECPF